MLMDSHIILALHNVKTVTDEHLSSRSLLALARLYELNIWYKIYIWLIFIYDIIDISNICSRYSRNSERDFSNCQEKARRNVSSGSNWLIYVVRLYVFRLN